MEFRREIRCEPGYDYTVEDADKPWVERRGVHGLNMRWLLHGERGTMQFLIYTGWLPSWVRDGGSWGLHVEANGTVVQPPMGADFGHHWDTPTYEGEAGPRGCDVRPSGQCFYDGSGLGGDHLLGVLLRDGHEAVWREMEERYLSYMAEEQR